MSAPSKDALLANARALRKEMTPWERKLWYLFLRSCSVKFYKQRVIGPYIVDFCCPSAKLIVELDGSQHFVPEGQRTDAERDARLAVHGYAILRFPNADIDGRFPEVCEAIQREVERRMHSDSHTAPSAVKPCQKQGDRQTAVAGPIRPAVSADASRIAEIIVFNNRVNYYPIFGDAGFSFGKVQVLPLARALLDDPEFLPNTWVWDDGVVKGVVIVRGGEIEKLYVEPAFQSLGVGAALLEYAANALGARWLWALEKNAGALRFYARHGFVPTGERRLEEGTPEYLLRLERKQSHNTHMEVTHMDYANLDRIVDSYRDELIENIRKWISVPSVQGAPAGENAPFGREVRRMLDMALEDGRRFGFETRDIDGYAGDISYGSGERTMGMLAHLDVVPLGDGWKHDPLGGEIEGGKLYGRGTTDDKGPALCALYAMRAVKEAGIPLRDGVRLILGCDEETGMSDMRHYASKLKMPDYGFSPDAEFPVINIEKGGVHLRLSKVTGGEDGADIPVYALYAGERPNVVPAEATAVVGLNGMDLQALNARLAAIALSRENFCLSAAPEGEGRAKITACGVNAHAAMPERGVNAAGMLLIALKELGAGGPGSRDAIAMLAEAVGMEYTGQSLGIACADELSGALTCNLGILRYDGNELSVLLDIRYPICGDEERMLGQAAKRVAPAGMSVCCAGSHTPLHVPADSEIVRGLLKVYHEVTGLPAYTIAIGGGTYSRMMPNTVAFGVCFPGDMDVCHIADEYIDLEKLMLGVKIFAHAIAEIAGGQIDG